MPIVNGKHYPYTSVGIAAAKKARKKKKGFHWSSVHVKEVQHPWVY